MVFYYNPGVPIFPSLEEVAAPLEEGEKSTSLGGNIKSQEGMAVSPAENKWACIYGNAEQKLVASKSVKRMTLPTRT